MIFFDRNKQKVSSIAKAMLDSVNQSGDAPDEVLEQIAKAQNLNEHWKQRVVEEFNILAFLQKLQDGTQHEHFQVAQPVIDECKQWLHIDWNQAAAEKNSGKMEKTASYNYRSPEEFFINANAFDYDGIDRFDSYTVSGDRFDDTIELEKVAFEKKQMLQDLQDEELIKEANYHIGKEENHLINELVKIANVSPGFTKSIIYDLYKKGHYSYAEDVMVESKYKPDEIMSSSIYDDVAPYEFEKLASVTSIIEDLSAIIPLKKMVSSSKSKAKKVIKHLNEKPIQGLMALVLGRGVKNAFTDNGEAKIAANIEAFKNQ